MGVPSRNDEVFPSTLVTGVDGSGSVDGRITGFYLTVF